MAKDNRIYKLIFRTTPTRKWQSRPMTALADLPDAPVAKRRFLPSSIGLTVLLPPDVQEIEARVTWGDYRTEPPLPEAVLLPDEPEATDGDGKGKKKERPPVDWVRIPKEQGCA